MHEPAYNPSVVPDITRSAPLTARHQQAPRPRRDPYDGLRPWSAITHGAGAVLALVGTAFLLVRAAGLEDWIKFSAFLVYGLSMIGLYTASTLYHCVNTTVRGRLALRKYDHCSIYLLIAGSYTPFLLITLEPYGGIVMFVVIWALAFAGISFEIIGRQRQPRWVTITIYLVMGWLVVFRLPQLVAALDPLALALLVVGGLCYTIGCAFYLMKKIRYMHSVWHLWVLAGSVCQFLAVLLFLL